jgi:anthranilate phosphoribosyltransferase
VLEALGIRIVLDAQSATRVLDEARVVFLFAPNFHPAMKHVGAVRRELGTPSLMNLVGPLANPASVPRQVIGVAERDRAAIVAEALVRLGAEHALVVHGRVGMDEISPHGVTDVWEVQDGVVRSWEIDPERFRLGIQDVGELQGGEPAANAERLERILGNGSADPSGLAAVLLNAGAAIYVAGIAGSLAEGIGRAREVVASGAARAALDRLRKATASIS